MNESDNKYTPIGKYGKFGLISQITQSSLAVNKNTVRGPGDDSAIIDSGESFTLVSTDLLLEGIHFNLVYTPLKHLGYKAVIRAISDPLTWDSRFSNGKESFSIKTGLSSPIFRVMNILLRDS